MNHQEIYGILSRTDPFEILEPDVLKDLAGKTEIRAYQANAYVFRQGDPSQDALFIIASGLAELVVTNGRGVETVIGLRRTYDFFGETVVLSQLRYPSTVRAKNNTVCCLVSRKNLEQLMYNYPEFCGFFNTLLAERMRLVYEELVAEQSYESTSGISGFNFGLFRKRVSEVMSHPVITCRTGDLVTDASKLMSENDIDAVVVLDMENKPCGILTEKNLVRYLIANQRYPVDSCRVENVMFSNLSEVRPHAFIGQALVAMMRKNTRHLIVMERGKLVGIVSMVDLVKTQSAGTLMLTRDIESQPDMGGLSLVNREIRKILREMVEEKATLYEIFDVMSELRERLTRRAIQLSEEKMKRRGWGPPPAEYCWISMGSGARYEQSFVTEQENALIFADPENSALEKTNAWFKKLAEMIVGNLEKCGFERCASCVTSANDQWRKSSSAWISGLGQNIRDIGDYVSCIVPLLDFRPVWGNIPLGEEFRKKFAEFFRNCLKTKSAESGYSTEYRLPIHFLGTFHTEKRGFHKNEMNLKDAALMPMIHSIRIMAAANGISELPTLERLKILTNEGKLSRADGASFSASFETMMLIKIRENMKKIAGGKRPDNYIDPYSLRKNERVALKDALSEVCRITEMAKEEFGGFWLAHTLET
ncbi:MAG: DUF294 nucleotidyltransferase-like domain-containing protein [Desulfococcaceae bacterium]